MVPACVRACVCVSLCVSGQLCLVHIKSSKMLLLLLYVDVDDDDDKSYWNPPELFCKLHLSLVNSLSIGPLLLCFTVLFAKHF